MPTNTLALITGASGGIGKELAHLHAQAGGDLVLVARRGDLLAELAEELQTKYQITATPIALDLITPNAVEHLTSMLKAKNLAPTVLINNAGFGAVNLFEDTDLDIYRAMIQLNMQVLTELCHHFLTIWHGNTPQGHILNVASVAGFMPGPYQAVYFATKNYVLALSEALAYEWRGRGVAISALCPGPVDTGFATAANATSAKGFKKMANVSMIAKRGYAGMLRGQPVIIPELPNRIIRRIVSLFPRTLLLKIVADMMRPQ